MTRTPRFLAALLLAALVGVPALGTAPAYAHTALVFSNPGDDSNVAALPETIVLEFSETIQEPAFVVVTDADGTKLHRGSPTVDGMTVRQPVKAATTSGKHTIAYRVVSADGHPVTGEITVSVDLEDDGPPVTEEPSATERPDAAGQPGADEPSADQPSAESTPTLPAGRTPLEPAASAPAADDGPSYLPISIALLAVLAVMLAGRLVLRRQRR